MYDKGKKIGMSRFVSAAGLLFIAFSVILLGGCQRRDSISLVQAEEAVTASQTSGEQISGEQTSGERISGEQISSERISGEQASVEQTAGEQQSSNAPGGSADADDAGENAGNAAEGSSHKTLLTEKQKDTSYIYVDVKGAVKTPGVYPLPAGARVYEAIAAAGGLLPEADSSVLNLAALLQDEDQLRIPYDDGTTGERATESSKESTTESVQKTADGGSPKDGKTENAAQQEIAYGLIRESRDKQENRQDSAGQETDSASAQNAGKVNINTASAQELKTLPGIGESKADAILAYRQSHGSFKTTEEIMQISGIKEGLYNKIKDKICAD